jgi:uncharacterized iron-regulated membrane protein
MTFKKIILKIHLWLGLASGIIVVILGLTGCIYAFEEELRQAVHDYYYVDTVKNQKLPVSRLIEIAKEANKDNPKQLLSGCEILTDPKRTAAISFSEELNPDSIWYWNRYQSVSVYIDPYTGSVKEIEKYNSEFFVFIRMLHQTLCLRNDIGDPIVGTATIIFIISLISGLILWWPKNKSAAKQRVWFRWKDTTKWKRKNYDLHNILGFYSILFGLIFALTGLVWAFQSYDNAIQWALNGGKTYEDEIVKSDTTHYVSVKPLDKVYGTLKQLHPKARFYYISIPGETNSSAVIYTFTAFKSRIDDVSIQFDQYSAKILKTTTYKDKNTGEKFRGINYDIHVGSILGLPGKILAFFASLICTSLPITGFLIWWGRKNKKSVKK